MGCGSVIRGFKSRRSPSNFFNFLIAKLQILLQFVYNSILKVTKLIFIFKKPFTQVSLMQTLTHIKIRLVRFYSFVLSSNSYLPYKYIVVKAFTSGRSKTLYLLRLIFPLNRLLNRLFLICVSSLHIFTSLLKRSSFFLPPRFWLLILYHFTFFYEVVLTLRLFLEWYPNVNFHGGGIIEQTIYELSEPYFMAFEETLPKELATLFSFVLIEHIPSIIGILCRTLIVYGPRKRSWIENVDLIVSAISAESLLAV